MNWDSGNIETNWKRYLQHAQLMFTGLLASKSEEQHVSRFSFKLVKKGRATHVNLLMTSERSLISYMKSSSYISHPDQTKYFTIFTI